MRVQRSKNDNGLDVDVTSFADVAFLLIIFFILTTTFVQPMGKDLSIPSGAKGESSDDQLTVNMKYDQIYYGEKGVQLSIEELRERLKKEKLEKKPEKQRMVILEAGPNVPYQTYFSAMTVISAAGGIVALVEESSKGSAGGSQTSTGSQASGGSSE